MTASVLDGRHPASIPEVLRRAQDRLEHSCVPEAEANAEFLLSAALGVSRTELGLRRSSRISDSVRRRFRRWVAERSRRKPLAYVLGRQPFMGLDIRVTPDVLAPRPETEEVVQAAIELCSETGPLRILDIGTGSGCIALALARALPRARVVGTDVSANALAVAEDNARRLGLAKRARFVREDLFSPAALCGHASRTSAAQYRSDPDGDTCGIMAAGTTGEELLLARGMRRAPCERSHFSPAAPCGYARKGPRERSYSLLAASPDPRGKNSSSLQRDGIVRRLFDLIVSNPPYIPSGRIPGLEPEVQCEPRLALDGGPDGLDAVGAVIARASNRLKPGGGLVLEIDEGQGARVRRRMRDHGFERVEIRRDLQGLERIAIGRVPTASGGGTSGPYGPVGRVPTTLGGGASDRAMREEMPPPRSVGKAAAPYGAVGRRSKMV